MCASVMQANGAQHYSASQARIQPDLSKALVHKFIAARAEFPLLVPVQASRYKDESCSSFSAVASAQVVSVVPKMPKTSFIQQAPRASGLQLGEARAGAQQVGLPELGAPAHTHTHTLSRRPRAQMVGFRTLTR